VSYMLVHLALLEWHKVFEKVSALPVSYLHFQNHKTCMVENSPQLAARYQLTSSC